jgi:hypothetical protein
LVRTVFQATRAGRRAAGRPTPGAAPPQLQAPAAPSPVRIPLVRQFGKLTAAAPPPPAPVRARAPRARPAPAPEPAAAVRHTSRPALLAAFRGGPPLLAAIVVSEALSTPVGQRSEPPGHF